MSTWLTKNRRLGLILRRREGGGKAALPRPAVSHARLAAAAGGKGRNNMGYHSLRNCRRLALALFLAAGLTACKNMRIEPPDQSFFTPNWCLPYGCSMGGG